MFMDKNQIIYTVVVIALMLGVTMALITGSIQQVNNFFMLQYAQMTGQFLNNDQVTFFTLASYPINNQIPMPIYQQMLANGSYVYQINGTYYIASQGLSIMPIPTPYYTPTPIGNYVSTVALNSLIYANNPSNLPQPNSYYIYPLYVMLYNANCSALTTQEIQQLNAPNPNLYMVSSCNATNNNATFYGLVGISNNTATSLDNLFTSMNPYYIAGISYQYPLAIYNQYGQITSNNTAINGTLLGYFVDNSLSYTFTNITGSQQTINPIRNVFSGNATNGEVFLDDMFCWNINQTTLTNYLLTQGYTQYPYLYQYQLNNSRYLCLSVNATNTLLNASSNLDNSAFAFNPQGTTINATTLSNYDYLIANQVGYVSTFNYLYPDASISISNVSVVNPPYWFIPNSTYVFALEPAPDYEFTEVTASQYYVSTYLPIYGQNPPYQQVSFNVNTNGMPLVNSTISSVQTYLYSALLSNITYQYQFNQPQYGTPVYCTDICQYNGSLVYQDYMHAYQYANPDFGYLVLPQLNQTLYYTPQFSIIANTPLVNDTNVLSPHYGQYCYYTGSPYTCQYGLSPSQLFQISGNYTAFIIYERINPADVWEVGSQVLTGWDNFVGYLNQTVSNGNTIVTISKLSPNGSIEYSVTGKVVNVNPSFIYIIPNSYNIDVNNYPPALPLTTSTFAVVEFIVFIILIPFLSYLLVSIKLKDIYRKV